MSPLYAARKAKELARNPSSGESENILKEKFQKLLYSDDIDEIEHLGKMVKEFIVLRLVDNLDQLKTVLRRFRPDPFRINHSGETALQFHQSKASSSCHCYLGGNFDLQEVLKNITPGLIVKILTHYEKIYRARVMSIYIDCARTAISESMQAKADKDVIKIMVEYLAPEYVVDYNQVGPLTDQEMYDFVRASEPVIFYQSLVMEKASKEQPKKIIFKNVKT